MVNRAKLFLQFIILIFFIILFNNCGTNGLFILRDYQDRIYPIHNEEPVKGTVKQWNETFSYWMSTWVDATPWRELVIYFQPEYDDGSWYQNARTDIRIELCTRKPYNKIQIYEISCNNVILLENKEIPIPGMGRVNIDNKEIEIDGDAFYMLYRVYRYSWTHLVAGSTDTKTFIDRKLGKSQTILIKQVYSLDDEPAIEEFWAYRVEIGADNRLELNPMWILTV